MTTRPHRSSSAPPYAAGLASDILAAFTVEEDLADALQRICEAMVDHFGAAFARIWTLGESAGVLELEASAGLYTHLDGAHGRIKVGDYKIGRIAQSREPILTNDVPNDPHISDPEWARREGMQAFAGYPLVVGDTLVGVMAMFSTTELDAYTLEVLGLVAHSIAAGIERRRAEARVRENARIAEVVLGVSEVITSKLELQDVVQTVTDAATELTRAAFGAFFYTVVDSSGDKLVLYTISGVSPDRFAGYPPPRNTAVFGPTFMGEGPVRIADVTIDPRYGRNPPYNGLPPDHLPVRSYLAVPVISPTGEVLGGLFFGHPEVGVFTSSAERIALGIAGQAAVAIQNARAHGIQSTIAATLQRSLLSPALPKLERARVAARYRPGLPELDVGGDWYDAVDLGASVAITVGDVMGKGLPAASLMSQVRAAFRAYVIEGRPLDAVLGSLNEMVCRDWPTHLATMVCGAYSWSDGRLELARAGHLPPLLVPAAARPTYVSDGGGIPLGVDRTAGFSTTTVALAPGDRVVLFTDGLVEDRRQPSIDSSMARLLDIVEASRATHPEALCDRILHGLGTFDKNPDDIALLVLEASLPD